MAVSTTQFFPKLKTYLEEIKSEIDGISAERRETLNEISTFVKERLGNGLPIELIFICTHNSRRSHFGQVWAQVWAAYFGYDQVKTFSGGTEATAFNPNAIRALRETGLEIVETTPGSNPHYQVNYSTESFTEAWSKVYSDSKNPQADFCAVMTCNEADEACPVVFGAGKRVALPFIDPKKSDGTPEEAATYALRCRQIAQEMYVAFSAV